MDNKVYPQQEMILDTFNYFVCHFFSLKVKVGRLFIHITLSRQSVTFLISEASQ